MATTKKQESLRDIIFGAEDIKKEKLYIPEWGVDVYVKTMSAGEKESFEGMFIDESGKRKDVDSIRATLAVLTCVDAKGNKVFERGDEERLKDKSASALTRIANVAQRLNALTDGEVEELAKN